MGLCLGCSLNPYEGKFAKSYKEYYEERWSSSSFLNGVLVSLDGSQTMRLATEPHLGLLCTIKCLGYSLTYGWDVSCSTLGHV